MENEFEAPKTPPKTSEKGGFREGVFPPSFKASFEEGLENTPELASKKGVFRGKTALRLKYEAEVEMIRRKYGRLEDMRELLGLSQRKICQLLLVDPSAWNRWTKQGEKAPPHIYRALEWYMHLQEKNPTLDQRYWLSQITRPISSQSEGLLTTLNDEMTRLKTQLEEMRRENSTREVYSTRQNARAPALGWDWKLALAALLVGVALGIVGVRLI